MRRAPCEVRAPPLVHESIEYVALGTNVVPVLCRATRTHRRWSLLAAPWHCFRSSHNNTRSTNEHSNHELLPTTRRLSPRPSRRSPQSTPRRSRSQRTRHPHAAFPAAPVHGPGPPGNAPRHTALSAFRSTASISTRRQLSDGESGALGHYLSGDAALARPQRRPRWTAPRASLDHSSDRHCGGNDHCERCCFVHDCSNSNNLLVVFLVLLGQQQWQQHGTQEGPQCRLQQQWPNWTDTTPLRHGKTGPRDTVTPPPTPPTIHRHLQRTMDAFRRAHVPLSRCRLPQTPTSLPHDTLPSLDASLSNVCR